MDGIICTYFIQAIMRIFLIFIKTLKIPKKKNHKKYFQSVQFMDLVLLPSYPINIHVFDSR